MFVAKIGRFKKRNKYWLTKNEKYLNFCPDVSNFFTLSFRQEHRCHSPRSLGSVLHECLGMLGKFRIFAENTKDPLI